MSRELRNLMWFGLGVVLAFFLMVPYAFAGSTFTIVNGQQSWAYEVGGTVISRSSVNPAAGGFPLTATATGASTSSAAAGVYNTARNVAVSAGGGAAKVVVDRVGVKAIDVAKRAALGARGGIGGVVASVIGTMIADALITKGEKWMADQQAWVKTSYSGSGTVPTGVRVSGACPNETFSGMLWSQVLVDCGTGVLPADPTTFTGVDCSSVGYSQVNGQCFNIVWKKKNSTQTWTYKIQVPNGANLVGTTALVEESQVVADLDTVWQTNSTSLKAVGDALPLEVPSTAPATVEVPDPVVESPFKVISKETITNPDGTTTVRETKQKQVYTLQPQGNTMNDNRVTYNTTNVTNVYDNGVQTSSKEEPQDAQQPDAQPTDTALGDAPTLYTAKYPDGLTGVWRDSRPRFDDTPFYNSVKALFPRFGSGSCPVFSTVIDVGPVNFGAFAYDVPCWLFTVIKAFLILTAAFTARLILFGG